MSVTKYSGKGISCAVDKSESIAGQEKKKNYKNSHFLSLLLLFSFKNIKTQHGDCFQFTSFSALDLFSYWIRACFKLAKDLYPLLHVKITLLLV
jgi:hypothetical protein